MNTEQRIATLQGQTTEIERLTDDKPIKKVDGRVNNGGARKGAGGKFKETTLIAKGIKEYVDKHFQEDVKIEVRNPNGKSIIITKPRLVRALEVLYDIGIKDRNPDALNKWLDRALGRPVTKISTDDEHPPFQININIAHILNRAYGTNDPRD